MSTTFEVRRACGRSNQQVVVEHVRDHQPGHVFPYGELIDVLSAGCDREFNRKDVQQIVRLAKLQLLRDHQRTLAVITNVGYQLAHAKEHRGLAGVHTKRSQRQLRWALTTLENVRLDEMTTAERELHIAQCMINNTLYTEQQRILRKQVRHDQLIAGLTARLDQLEGQKEPKG